MPGRWPLNVITALIDAVPIVFREPAGGSDGQQDGVGAGGLGTAGTLYGRVESWLASRAYSASAADRLYQFDQLSHWLLRERLSASELTGEHAVRFAAGRPAAGLTRGCSFPGWRLRTGWDWTGCRHGR
jgi:hypothetical protein